MRIRLWFSFLFLWCAFGSPALQADSDSSPPSPRPSGRSPASVIRPPTPNPESEKAPQDKSSFTLFSPTPREQMRDLSPERPGSNDSPITVDSGHLMIETGIVSYSYHQSADSTTKSLLLNDMLIRVGLFNHLDAQLGIQSYGRVSTQDALSSNTKSGIGNLAFRMKWNLVGNEGESPMALAILPMVSIPTQKDGIGSSKWEPALKLPASLILFHDFGLSAMPEWARKEDNQGDSLHDEFALGVSISHSLVSGLTGYLEFTGQMSTERGSQAAIGTGFGFAYLVGKDIQLDAGLNLGLVASQDDFNPFCGFVIRY